MKNKDTINLNARDIAALAKQDGVSVDAYVKKLTRLAKEDSETEVL